MAIFDRNYDYGYRTGGSFRGYDRDWGNRGDRVYGTTGGWTGAYDRGYETGAWGGAYDRNYKSRWQTDYGDPFGDRTSHTPMYMTRGEYEGAYDRNYRAGYDRDLGAGYNRNLGYDRQYMHGTNYDPYYGTTGTWGRAGYGARGYDRGYRGWGNDRGYDTGWF